MVIREISLQDFFKWQRLRHLLWPYHTLEELCKEMEEIYKRTSLDYMFYVAEDNEDILGFIEISIRETALGCKTNNVGFIEGLYVIEEVRKKGIGKLLIEKGESWAFEKGCKEMASDTNERYPISPIVHKLLGYEEVDSPFNFKKYL